MKQRPPYYSIERLSKLQKHAENTANAKINLISSSINDFAEIIDHPFAWCNKSSVAKFIAHYELFNKIKSLPGHIVELGVFKGNGLLTFHNLMEIFSPLDRTRKVFGFDHFEGLKNFSEKDGEQYDWGLKFQHGFQTDPKIVHKLVSISNDDCVLAGDERTILIEGDICETVPKFILDMPGFKISLLIIDTDMYMPTKVALDCLYDLVVPGGYIVFDEYGLMPYEGETKAVDEFIDNMKLSINFEKFTFASSPSAFFKKL